jgi:hypothetical protein
MNTLQFFKDRIGKRIYRDDNGCECLECKNVVENGIIVQDKQKARYLYDVSCELGIEYRDEK